MDKFVRLTAAACPVDIINLNTDQLLPARFLKRPRAEGIGDALLRDLRFDSAGHEVADFPLNRPAWRDAKIIVGARNFGCGSSREAAAWALLRFGIRVVVAPSFADIFYGNCFKNGILPIVLPQEAVDHLMDDAKKGANARITVDLESQTVTASDGTSYAFDVDPFKKHCLLNGLDDIGLTLEKSAAIDSFEKAAAQARPWV